MGCEVRVALLEAVAKGSVLPLDANGLLPPPPPNGLDALHTSLLHGSTPAIALAGG